MTRQAAQLAEGEVEVAARAIPVRHLVVPCTSSCRPQAGRPLLLRLWQRRTLYAAVVSPQCAPMIGSHTHVDSARSYALRYASPRASSACTPSSSRTARHGTARQRRWAGRSRWAGQGRAQLCRYGLTQPERRYHAEVVRVVAHVHDQIDPLLGAVGREVSHRVVPRVSHVAVHADPRRPALHRVTRQHSRIVGATAKPTSAIAGTMAGTMRETWRGTRNWSDGLQLQSAPPLLTCDRSAGTRSSTQRVEYWSSTH